MAGHGRVHGQGAGQDGQGDLPLEAAAWEHMAPGLSPGEGTLLWEAVVPVHVATRTRTRGGGHELCVAVVPTQMATGGHSLQPQGDHRPPGSSFVTSLWEAPCGKMVGSEEKGSPLLKERLVKRKEEPVRAVELLLQQELGSQTVTPLGSAPSSASTPGRQGTRLHRGQGALSSFWGLKGLGMMSKMDPRATGLQCSVAFWATKRELANHSHSG